MQIISVCIGLFAALWMLVGLVVNLLNWITLPLCVLGVIFGVFGKGKRPWQFCVCSSVAECFELLFTAAPLRKGAAPRA